MESKGSNELVEDVQKKGLCTGCGACVNLCPYFRNHKGKTGRLFQCDVGDGRCYSYCPRTSTDFSTLYQNQFDTADLTVELGAFKKLYITRATDETIRQSAQHGGTVSALLRFALSEGIIDTAVLADEDSNMVPSAKGISDPDEVIQAAKSKFVLPPMVGQFNAVARGPAEKIGIVAVPCQSQALAKMKESSAAGFSDSIGKLKLVVGLFCGWGFDWEKLNKMLKEKVEDPILKLDIPPSKHKRMDVTTLSSTITIPIDEVQECVTGACDYCLDMTCEFADISVGSARSQEGWDVDKGWNQVIVRTKLGMDLLEKARSQGILEFREVPEGNLEKLKWASMSKKKNSLKNITNKSGNENDFIYLNENDSMIRNIQNYGG